MLLLALLNARVCTAGDSPRGGWHPTAGGGPSCSRRATGPGELEVWVVEDHVLALLGLCGHRPPGGDHAVTAAALLEVERHGRHIGARAGLPVGVDASLGDGGKGRVLRLSRAAGAVVEGVHVLVRRVRWYPLLLVGLRRRRLRDLGRLEARVDVLIVVS